MDTHIRIPWRFAELAVVTLAGKSTTWKDRMSKINMTSECHSHHLVTCGWRHTL